jgi:hypothetical protein
MPHNEITGFRSKAYSLWHRTDSIKRFFNGNKVVASRLTMIDIDGVFVEAKHPYDRPPVALIEAAQVNYQLTPQSYHSKSSRILYQLGKAANIPVFLVLYLLNLWSRNPLDEKEFDILEFYVKEQYPQQQELWTIYTPDDYAMFLVALRENHISMKRNGQQLPMKFIEGGTPIGDSGLLARWNRFDWTSREIK